MLVGFFLLHLETVFTSARFSLTANVTHWTLDLVLCCHFKVGIDEILIFVIRSMCFCLLL